MALIDSYRDDVARKRGELAKLSENKARESAKIAPLKSKIIAAQSAISRIKSASTIKSKYCEIERAEKSLAGVDKSIADIDKKVAAKEKEIANAEKKVRQEQDKNENQRTKDEKQRLRENERQIQSINQSLRRHDFNQAQLSVEIEKLKYIPDKITVLFFATNPLDTDRLRLDEEVRTIQEMIRKSEHRDSIVFESRWAVRPLDILQEINVLNPDIVHFSGHGSDTSELVLENADGTAKQITKEAITQAIMMSSDKIRFMFFNACFSYGQAQSVIEYVDAAIGMTDSIGDEGACAFAAQFYSSLGFGFSVKKAFEQAKGALMLVSPTEESIPELYIKDGIESDEFYLVKPKDGV